VVEIMIVPMCSARDGTDADRTQRTLILGTTLRRCSSDNELTLPSLVGTGHVDKAAIFNSEGNSVWATSAGFQVTPKEMQDVVAAFKDTSEPKKVQMSGLHIAGQKYFVLKADDAGIYGKQVRALTSKGLMRLDD
jgi:hypothetical protein